MTNSPVNVQAGLQAAIARHQASQFAEAEALYREVLARAPGHPDALHLLGLLAFHQGRNDAALELIGQALRFSPQHAPAHSNLGNALLAAGRTDEAIASFQRALALQPALAEAHSNLGNALRALGQLDEAVECYRQALALRPDFAEAHNNLGFALWELGRSDPALASIAAALRLRPDFPEALNNQGLVLEAQGQPEAALASLDRALALRPDYVEALNNRGNALKALGRLDEAVGSYRQALALRPGYAEAHNNLGQALEASGRADLALPSFERALALRPDLAQARWNKSIALLLTGDFAAGWPLYEARWAALGPRAGRREFPVPLWLGDAPLAGRTLLLHHEQGLGDTLQMLRYVPLLAAQGVRVVLELPPPLARIAATVPGAALVITEGDALPPFDLHCPMLSLPLACGTTLGTVPREVPYLFVPHEAPAAWQDRLGPRTRPRVGLAWSGARGHRNDRQRSLPLAGLLPLLQSDADFVSLQTEYREADRALLGGLPNLRDCAPELGDFADTAGLIAQLDLVITVDTSVAHLAGALGRPVWLLLPYAPDYRWLLGREDSPWYPTMRLFRQPATGDWATVLDRVGGGLEARLRHVKLGP